MPSKYNLSPIQYRIWDEKYRLKDGAGNNIDKWIDHTWGRVAVAISYGEADSDNIAYWRTKFYEILEDFKFLPAGRIIAGAGTDRDVTLQNCYVLGTINDNLPDIFSALREAAITLKSGGGIGHDFSTIRYKGAPVLGVGADASGPLSFMEVWNTMCATMMGAGVRRGAMMGTMQIDHPDILDFIKAKQEAGRLTNFNVSVLVTDAFMDALEGNMLWDLVWGGSRVKTLPARELWDALMRATYDYAEPGVIFIDRMNNWNNLNYCEMIATTNPCGEQPLPPYGACCLGSLNLTKFIDKPFTNAPGFNYDDLKETIHTAVRFLDNVVTISKYPLDAQKLEAYSKRRIGLGITGLADALAMLGFKYGSPDAIAFQTTVQRMIRNEAYIASAKLAKEKGAFPLYDKEKLNKYTINQLSPEAKMLISLYGLRNSHLISIAPTGTISLLAGNVSSGIEPIFSLRTERTRLGKDGLKTVEVINDYAYKMFCDLEPSIVKGNNYHSDVEIFATAQDLPVNAHLAVLATAQHFCDSAVSKTINLPESISFEDFSRVYLDAYKAGAKGCTTYRPSGVRGAVLRPVDPPLSEPVADVLEISEEVREEIKEALNDATYEDPALIHTVGAMTPVPLASRPPELQGVTYKLKWPREDAALYFVVNDIEEAGIRRIHEIFLISKSPTHYPWWSALTRMISAIYRRGGDVAFVADELMEVFDPKGGAWIDRKFVPSQPALLGAVLKKHQERLDKKPINPEDASLNEKLKKYAEISDVALNNDQHVEVSTEEPETHFFGNNFVPGRKMGKTSYLLNNASTQNSPVDVEIVSVFGGERCPKCSYPTYIRQEGCGSCSSCGYSRC